MYCINCGTELVVSNQKFCHNCGERLPDLSKVISKDISEETESHRQTSKIVKQQKWEYTNIPERKLKPRRMGGPPGPFSKSCLTFAIVSIAIAVFSIVALVPIILLSMILYHSYAFLTWIIIIFMNSLGICVGFYSRLNSKKAETFDPLNSVEKAGSILAIIGIIVNLIPLVFTLLFFRPYLY